MIKLFAILFFVLHSISIFTQNKDDDEKVKEFARMLREVENSKGKNNPVEAESFIKYFKPELIDSFFKYIKEDNYSKLYENSDDLLKKIQSEEDFTVYFKSVKKYYGLLKNYKQERYGIRNQPLSINKLANASYTINFDSTSGRVSFAFNVIDSATIKLQSFQLEIKDYEKNNIFDSIAKPTFSLLTAKDFVKIYNSTSSRFQKYTSIGKYEDFINKIKELDFTDQKLYQSQIGVSENKPQLYLFYEVNKKRGILTLTYIETKTGYELEGINYQPKNK